MVDITEEEAEQYDRQIRLWGLEAQKRLVIVEKTGKFVKCDIEYLH